MNNFGVAYVGKGKYLARLVQLSDSKWKSEVVQRGLGHNAGKIVFEDYQQTPRLAPNGLCVNSLYIEYKVEGKGRI